MVAEPPGLRRASVRWVNNIAAYGVMVATQAVYIYCPTYVNILSPTVPEIKFELLDFYSQRLIINQTTSVAVAINKSECGTLNPYLTGSDLLLNAVTFHNGEASFNYLQAFCAPGGTMSLTFEARLGVMTILSATVASVYYIHNYTTLRFRECMNGEYDNAGVCTTCPNGSYSFTNFSACTSCVYTKGVSNCWSNKILVAPGFWRRYPSNLAVLECPIVDGCKSGTGTGDELCAEGYEGPLCGVCSSGFTSNDGKCVVCNEQNLITFKTVFIFVIVFLAIVGLFVVLQEKYLFNLKARAFDEEGMKYEIEIIRSRLTNQGHNRDWFFIKIYLWFKIRSKMLMSKVLIIVATFQVIMMLPTTFRIIFPTNAISFFNAFSVLYFSFNVFPVSCFQNYDFIYTLIFTTLLPIFVVVALLFAFLIQYYYATYALTKKNKNKDHFNSVAENKFIERTLKNHYIYLFLLLTILVIPHVTTTIFQMFPCHDIDPDHEDNAASDLFLFADLSIDCNSNKFIFGKVWAIFMILCYPLGQ